MLGADPDGEAVHAGSGAELCIETHIKRCDRCEGEGQNSGGPPDAEGFYPGCAACGGRGQLATLGWLKGRFEYDFHNKAALFMMPAAGVHNMKAVVPEDARFRLTVRDRR